MDGLTRAASSQRRDRWQVADREAVHEDLYQDQIDLAKNFFQVHAIEREGAPAVSRKVSRGKVLAFFAQTAPCRVGMELLDRPITGREGSGRWGTKWS